MNEGRVRIIAVGDIAPDRADPNESFTGAAALLRRADVAFCQLEVNLTRRGTRLPQARHAVRGDPAIAPALAAAGFHVVSFADNHSMDWGAEALADTLEALTAAGLRPVGAGPTITAARAPVVVESKGLRIGFLAYCSILPQSYWADERRAGVAPMRAFTIYEQIEHDQPGTPCRVHTYPHRDDLAAMEADIRALRTRADVVIVSHHWGIHFVPHVVADYQRDVGRAAIEAGADAVIGHHAHILKGIEFHRGRPIFYSLGNFAIDLRMDEAHAASKSFKEIQALNPDWVVNFDSLYNFPPASRRSMAVQLTFEAGAAAEVAVLPVWIGDDARPEVLRAGDPRFDEVVATLRAGNAHHGFATDLVPDGDVVRIRPAG